MSPGLRLRDPTSGVWKLAGLEIGGHQLVPPVVAYPVRRFTAQLSCGLVFGRVDGANRDAITCGLNGEFQVAVVADHQRGIDALFEDVEQQVSGHIHIGALFLTPRNGDEESRVGGVQSGAIFDGYRPSWGGENRTPTSVFGGQGAEATRLT